nr:hypothetical protein [Lysinibacillus timonensis]
MEYYYNPEVRLLLINQSKEKEPIKYGTMTFKLPLIGPRPPYYLNPRYEPYYPAI